MQMIRISTVISLVFSPINTLAQALPDGSMTYAPAATQEVVTVPVPISAMVLIPLGLLMAFFGLRALRNGGARKLLALLLAVSGSVTFIGGIGFSQNSWAPPNITSMSNPAGDTVGVPADVLWTFVNNSGVNHEITALAPPCDAPNTAPEPCGVGLAVPDQGQCATEYACTCVAGVIEVELSIDPPDANLALPYDFVITVSNIGTSGFTLVYLIFEVNGGVDDLLPLAPVTVLNPGESIQVKRAYVPGPGGQEQFATATAGADDACENYIEDTGDFGGTPLPGPFPT